MGIPSHLSALQISSSVQNKYKEVQGGMMLSMMMMQWGWYWRSSAADGEGEVEDDMMPIVVKKMMLRSMTIQSGGGLHLSANHRG